MSKGRTYQRIAPGDYQSRDGVRIYRHVGVFPPAWTAYRVDDDHDVILADGAATLADAKALADAAYPSKGDR